MNHGHFLFYMQIANIEKTMMRNSVVSVICLSIWFLMLGSTNASGQTDFRPPASAWHGKTILPQNENIEALRVSANDSTKSQAGRSLAIFSLFAYQLHPPATSEIAYAAFNDTAWLRNSFIQPIHILAGMIPVAWSAGDSVFSIALFPETANKDWSPWTIYLHFSGRLQDGDAVKFFSNSNSFINSNLVEFALCFPDGRIERFAEEGIMVIPAHGSESK